jgi:hypothetical protein
MNSQFYESREFRRFFHRTGIAKAVILKLTKESSPHSQLPLSADCFRCFWSRFFTADPRTTEENSSVLVPEKRKATFVSLRKSPVSRLFEAKQFDPLSHSPAEQGQLNSHRIQSRQNGRPFPGPLADTRSRPCPLPEWWKDSASCFCERLRFGGRQCVWTARLASSKVVIGMPLSVQLKVIPLKNVIGNDFIRFSLRERSEQEEGNSEDTDCFLLFFRLTNWTMISKCEKEKEIDGGNSSPSASKVFHITVTLLQCSAGADQDSIVYYRDPHQNPFGVSRSSSVLTHSISIPFRGRVSYFWRSEKAQKIGESRRNLKDRRDSRIVYSSSLWWIDSSVWLISQLCHVFCITIITVLTISSHTPVTYENGRGRHFFRRERKRERSSVWAEMKFDTICTWFSSGTTAILGQFRIQSGRGINRICLIIRRHEYDTEYSHVSSSGIYARSKTHSLLSN